jgi:hypothetical protein
MTHPKEISFFNRDENYRNGLEWYSSFFNNWKDEPIGGESTPSYLWDERVPPRIKKDLPDAKFIVLLRNPVERAYSAYWFAFIGGNEILTFKEGLAAEAERAKQGDKIRGYSSYIDRGMYASQITRYFDLFPRSQFLFLISEEYRNHPDIVLEQVTQFLGIEYHTEFYQKVRSLSRNVSRIPRSRAVHRCVPFLVKHFDLGARVVRRLNLKTGKYPPIDQKMRRRLYSIFENSIKELEILLDRNLDIWKP